ncbi:Protein RAE1 [Capsicum annuum]|nr:Protein RAE1 [Capsicum annuum]
MMNATITAGLGLVPLNLWCNMKRKHHSANASVQLKHAPYVPLWLRWGLISALTGRVSIPRHWYGQYVSNPHITGVGTDGFCLRLTTFVVGRHKCGKLPRISSLRTWFLPKADDLRGRASQMWSWIQPKSDDLRGRASQMCGIRGGGRGRCWMGWGTVVDWWMGGGTVQQPPADSVTSLCFSPKANLLVATSWDNQVRCWEVMGSGTNIGTVPKAAISHEQPVLCSAWKDDGTTVFSGGCDKQVKMWPLSGSQPVTIAMHDAPVRELAWIPEMNLLVTGSWDKTLRYWDLRQQNPVHIQQLPERCYALTVKHPLMVAGTADKNLIVFNLQNPQCALFLPPANFVTMPLIFPPCNLGNSSTNLSASTTSTCKW